MKDIKTDICENRQKAANAWKNVMKGPPTAPVCKGGIISEDRFNLVPFSKKNYEPNPCSSTFQPKKN